jgi:hypothetical protein
MVSAKTVAKVQSAEDDVKWLDTLGNVGSPWKCAIGPISAHVWSAHLLKKTWVVVWNAIALTQLNDLHDRIAQLNQSGFL